MKLENLKINVTRVESNIKNSDMSIMEKCTVLK